MIEVLFEEDQQDIHMQGIGHLLPSKCSSARFGLYLNHRTAEVKYHDPNKISDFLANSSVKIILNVLST